MYYDFKNLYDYLVDTESNADLASQRPASGGICVLQNVANFNTRHGFKPQPHPLPLLPTYTSLPKRSDSQKALRQLTLASQHNKTHQLHTMDGALTAATNVLDSNGSKIVQAYMHFEKAHATNSREEKITAIDARKVRWLVIYGTLQYLVSAIRAPKEVRDTETPDYPLCYLAEPASNTTSRDTTPLASPSVNIPQAIDEYLSESQSSPYSIQPDCQREDYFTPRNQSQRSSMEVLPLRIAQPLRQSSVRSFGLSARSSRRNSVALMPTQHCAIIIPTYGDGLNDPAASSVAHNNPRPCSSVYSEQSIASILPDGAGPETSWLRPRTPSAPHSRQPSTGSTVARTRTPLPEPLLDFAQLDRLSNAMSLAEGGEPPSRSDSTSSTASSTWSEGASAASSKSSACGEHAIYKISTAEESGLLGGLVSVGAPIERSTSKSITTTTIPQSHIHPLLRQPTPPDGFQFGFDSQKPEVTHDDLETSDFDSIGMAVFGDAPSSPKMNISPDLHPTFTAVEARSLISEKRPYLPPRPISMVSTPDSIASSSKKAHGSFTSVSIPGKGYWDQYRATLTQQKERSEAGSPTDSTPPPISRHPTAFKVPYSRLARPGNEEDRGVKRERRLFSLWRR
jgi:hypothetical protein